MTKTPTRIFATALLVTGLASAHHFLVAAYDFDHTVTVAGRVTEFLLRKPHSYVKVEGLDQDRRQQAWLVEWSDSAQLGRAGITFDTLKPGDRVVVTGNPSRHPGERKMRMQTIVRPADGWKWSGEEE